MKIEFQAKWIKIKEEKDTMSAEDRKIQRLLGNDDEPEAGGITVEYEYEPVVIDLYDIKTFNRSDKDHVTLRMDTGDVFNIKCKWRIFKFMYEQVTGRILRNINDFKFEEELVEKADIVNEVLNRLKIEETK